MRREVYELTNDVSERSHWGMIGEQMRMRQEAERGKKKSKTVSRSLPVRTSKAR